MYQSSNIVMKELRNKNIDYFKEIIKPNLLLDKYKITENIENFVISSRNSIKKILNKEDDRMIFLIGPCSIHNIAEAKEYALDLKKLSDQVKDKIFIIMRVYFEKPRTTIGWKGLINDPDLDNTFDINKGLEMARELLLFINSIELPCGCEILDTISPQYISDLISWGAIGARTTESQVHRELVSGLSMPVGFKNGTGGSINLAIDALISSSYPHCFMGITDNGGPAICKTKGNKDCHIILRGGKNGPNYYSSDIEKTKSLLLEKNIKPNIMIDCSHGNSNKIFSNQKIVLENIIDQVIEYKKISICDNPIIGIMLESNLEEGNQKLTNKDSLKKGISITDACISMESTYNLVINSYKLL